MRFPEGAPRGAQAGEGRGRGAGGTKIDANDLDQVMAIVDKWDKDAFVTVEDPKILRGGSFATREWRIVSPFGRPGSVGGGTRQRV